MKRKLSVMMLVLCFLILVGCKDNNGTNNGGTEDEKETYLVTFNTGLGSDINSVSVNEGSTVSLPLEPIRIGYSFGGWYSDSECNIPFDFSTKINSNINLYSKWISNGDGSIDIDFSGLEKGELNLGSGSVISKGSINVTKVSGVYEGALIEFDKVNNATYNIYISEGENYKLLDLNNVYIREISSGVMRADLLGISSGKYNIKVCSVVDGVEQTPSICEINVVSYDRSGYAHYKYDSGVGAYKDDGTLKDNAIVIYVTDENKDYVMGEIEELSSYMFDIPNYFNNSWNSKRATGIGWWLNNTQYTKCENDSSGNPIASKSSNTYSPNGQKLGFYSVCDTYSIVIRFVGTVTAPEGLTAYDSVNEGGTVGDNGFMARMKDLKNVTLEGVGNDAVIKGWGFHFIASDRSGVRGESFEVRNLTFSEYPEDAIGMEGVQEGSKLVAPVERCWVHHCTFLPGYCANPAESDKGEGDGSCDFKRGQFYTMSYCYYEYCHKTNLIGSSDSSLQYNISFHHNVWYNCGSRIPLLRRANIHFYNNYVYCNANDSKAELSYVTSLRADSYMYSENNYFEGCKQVFDGKDGGVAKCFGNTYLVCYSSSNALSKGVDSRTSLVDSNCRYLDIDYSNFDTNPDLFYYDSDKKVSNCYLTTSSVAKIECIRFAGSYYRTIDNKCSLVYDDFTFNDYEINESLDLSSGSFDAVIGTNVSGLIFNGVKSNKFRGQGVTFKLNCSAIVNVTISSSSSETLYDGYLVKDNGMVMLYGSGTVALEAGTYYIISGQINKDSVISKLSFEKYDEEIYNENLLDVFNEKLGLLPDKVEYNDGYYYKVLDILSAYEKLSSEDKNTVSIDKVLKGYNNYLSLGRNYVNSLINGIGSVDVNSGNVIISARNAYNKYNSVAPFVNIDITNLINAEELFKSFAIDSCINKINSIGNVNLDSADLINIARDEYDSLNEEQKSLVNNYDVLVNAEKKYNSLLKIKSIDDKIENVNKNDINSLEDAYNSYYSLTIEEKEELANKDLFSQIKIDYLVKIIDSIGVVTNTSSSVINKALAVKENLTEAELILVSNLNVLNKAIEDYTNLQSQMHIMIFDNGLEDPNGYFIISGNLKSKIDPKTYDGITYTTAMKIESKTSITFTAGKSSKLVVISDGEQGDKIKVDGVVYMCDADGVFIIDVLEGQHVITKSTSLNVYSLIVQ